MSIEDQQAELYDKFENSKDQLTTDQIQVIENGFDEFAQMYEDDKDIDILKDQLNKINVTLFCYLKDR